MATGTVSLHSWNDGNQDDEADPPMASNYNARLDRREDFDFAARRARHGFDGGNGVPDDDLPRRTARIQTARRGGVGGRTTGLRSSAVPAQQRQGQSDDEDNDDGVGGIW